MSFLSNKQLHAMGFNNIGKEVLVSDKASLYNPSGISIGDYSRIDDFCIISASGGSVKIGRNVHVAAYAAIFGGGNAILEDFSGISGRSLIYTSNDDYSGSFLTNPTVPDKFRSVTAGTVRIGRHALVGAGCVILPDVHLGDGSRVGAMSLLTAGEYDVDSLYVGVPAKKVRDIKSRLPELEKKYLEGV